MSEAESDAWPRKRCRNFIPGILTKQPKISKWVTSILKGKTTAQLWTGIRRHCSTSATTLSLIIAWGSVSRNLDKPEAARTHYEAYLKILPHGPLAADAQKALEKIKPPEDGSQSSSKP